MKKLANFIVVAFVLGSMSSCSRYQMVTLSSNILKSDVEGCVFENDSVEVTYSFKGENCPVSIRIFNKLQKPLYVDWSKSAAIIDGNKLSYWKNNATLTATSDGTTYSNSVTSSQINGNIYKDDRISFIPPQSYVSLVPISLRYSFFDVSKCQTQTKVVMNRNIGTSNGTLYSFNSDSTPFKFRSYLTYSVNADISNPIYLDNTFWVSGIIQTMASPSEIIFKPSNQFYLSKSNGGGGCLGLTALLGLIVVVAASK